MGEWCDHLLLLIPRAGRRAPRSKHGVTSSVCSDRSGPSLGRNPQRALYGLTVRACDGRVVGRLGTVVTERLRRLCPAQEGPREWSHTHEVAGSERRRHPRFIVTALGVTIAVRPLLGQPRVGAATCAGAQASQAQDVKAQAGQNGRQHHEH
jgi:hypothetical protein